jgi:hypothetical protein
VDDDGDGDAVREGEGDFEGWDEDEGERDAAGELAGTCEDADWTGAGT